jgi:hypothetical protein
VDVDSEDDDNLIKSISLPAARSAENLYAHMQRDETYIERLHDFGTNIRYNFGTLKNLTFKPDGRRIREAYLLGKKYEILEPEEEKEEQGDSEKQKQLQDSKFQDK